VIRAEVAECYEKHGEALLRFAASQVGWVDAEDVLAGAVLGVLGRVERDIDDVRRYLYRAVANAAARHWRTLGRRRDRERRAFHPPEPTWGTVEPTDRELALVAALDHLSVQQRAVIHLTYWEDLTPAAVADRLGVSDGTVRRQLARARAHLRSAIDAD
jgi:RNA polymerase sigma-70 factor (ECF subfamily)